MNLGKKILQDSQSMKKFIQWIIRNIEKYYRKGKFIARKNLHGWLTFQPLAWFISIYLLLYLFKLLSQITQNFLKINVSSVIPI